MSTETKVKSIIIYICGKKRKKKTKAEDIIIIVTI